MITVLVALAVALAALGLGAAWLHGERQQLRERELANDHWTAALGRREADIRRRERALWWAEKSRQWLS